MAFIHKTTTINILQACVLTTVLYLLHKSLMTLMQESLTANTALLLATCAFQLGRKCYSCYRGK